METVKDTLGTFDVQLYREDFPALKVKPYGKNLVYLDNAATSQKPQAVIDALVHYYTHENANIHRGVHYLSQAASAHFDAVREQVASLINARSTKEVVFTRGTTESINLVAASWGRAFIQEGDEILISAMEHHSNIVPWQLICEEKKATLKVIPMNDAGELMLDQLPALLNERTKLVAVVHTSNSLGSINPVSAIIEQAHTQNIPVLVDAAQAMVHEAIDVQALDCDFLVFSAHKMLGPTGVGVLYGKEEILTAMPPYQGGGDMIRSVRFEGSTWNELPYKFEAGTPNIADVIAFGAAISYLGRLDRQEALAHEVRLANHVTQAFLQIPEIRLIGTARNKSAVVSFVIDGVNALDAGMYLDTKGIAVRTGHHCTEPVMDRMGIVGSIRASFLFYNTMAEADFLIEQVKRAIAFLKPRD